MKKYLFFALFFIYSVGYSLQLNSIPKNLEVKLDKVLKEQFQDTHFTKELLLLSPEQLKEAKFNNESDIIYKLKDKAGKSLGFVYVGKAKSKVSLFDYAVVFDQNLTIANVKVLIYREDHGGEISSKRWLQQFLGFEKNQSIVYKKDVAGISGATISASSLTNAVNDVLKTVGILNQLKKL